MNHNYWKVGMYECKMITHCFKVDSESQAKKIAEGWSKFDAPMEIFIITDNGTFLNRGGYSQLFKSW
ncbi:hypothetical protein HMI01_15320 [Halolactibacillus miurensis]|uniref:Uncharacterized protein n=1 Tax=Halolactibacillus miurensis TaxID=306541 RepID=A0A1I6RYE1_9BACI|nr:hypothetical protein [Halolactibacillus miurensis]GEM04544.1 hypothetical protein HMI01_15320 [Halolactibacillus miurensis]SFS69712.1 hypothetical protein SAMN05421668_10731 [Halolactibacillus miurensis]